MGTLGNLDPAVWHTISAGEPIDVPEKTDLGSVTLIEIDAAAPPSFPYAYPTVKKSVTTVCGGREGRRSNHRN